MKPAETVMTSVHLHLILHLGPQHAAPQVSPEEQLFCLCAIPRTQEGPVLNFHCCTPCQSLSSFKTVPNSFDLHSQG